MEGDHAWRPALDQEGLERVDWTSQVKDYAIIRLDSDGLVLSWNAGAELVTGYPREEVLGRSFEVFYTPEDREAGLPRRLLGSAQRDGRVEDTGWRLRRDGTRFWADVVVTAVHDEAGTLLGFVKVTRDLTEQHRLERSREQFIAGVTHDFRSPLTSIEGYAAMLASELSDPVLGDFASRIRSNAVRLMKLVDLMVEHCHMPVGGVGLSVEPVCLATVLRTVVDDLSTTVQGHEVTVQDTDVVLPADLTARSRELSERYAVWAQVPDTHFHCGFGHLEGYGSGYYTYMWSLVIAKDLFSAFDAGDLFAPEVATRYRDTVLAAGGSRDAADLVEEFLGRPYDNRAFTAWLES